MEKKVSFVIERYCELDNTSQIIGVVDSLERVSNYVAKIDDNYGWFFFCERWEDDGECCNKTNLYEIGRCGEIIIVPKQDWPHSIS